MVWEICFWCIRFLEIWLICCPTICLVLRGERVDPENYRGNSNTLEQSWKRFWSSNKRGIERLSPKNISNLPTFRRHMRNESMPWLCSFQENSKEVARAFVLFCLPELLVLWMICWVLVCCDSRWSPRPQNCASHDCRRPKQLEKQLWTTWEEPGASQKDSWKAQVSPENLPPLFQRTARGTEMKRNVQPTSCCFQTMSNSWKRRRQLESHNRA